jgi:hypothetical protein
MTGTKVHASPLILHLILHKSDVYRPVSERFVVLVTLGQICKSVCVKHKPAISQPLNMHMLHLCLLIRFFRAKARIWQDIADLSAQAMVGGFGF